MEGRRVPALLAKLGELQARHPWHFLALGLLTLLPALYGILGRGGLGFRPDFTELLPANKSSVIEMRRVSARLPGDTTLTIVAQIDDGKNRAALERFVDQLVPKLAALGPDKVGAIDYGVKDARAFFEKNALLYADYDELRRAHDEIVERYDWEIAKRAGTLLDDAEPPPPISAESVERRLRAAEPRTKSAAPTYPDGYYMNPEGTLIAVLIRTPVSGKAQKQALRKEVSDVVESLHPRTFDASLRVGYTGRMIVGEEEYDAIVGDLMHVGGWGLLGVLLSVFLFFLRARTLLALGVTIGVSLLWTFGLTRLTIGYLNSSTGFLVSIIAGNGINYGIMYVARYVEARRDERKDVAESILLAHRDSWLPTLAGSATAMLAYGSLVLTDFRGFKHFGIISGYGMILCWVVTYTLLPAVLAASERILPSFREHRAPARFRGYYGIGPARLARFAPRFAIALGVLAGGLSLYATSRYLAGDPMEYDMKKVRNERDESKGLSVAANLNTRVDDVVGRLGQDGMAIMTDRLDQVPMLETELMKRWQAAPAKEKPFEKVVTIFSLLPARQADKLPLIAEMTDRITRAKKLGLVSDGEWEKIAPHLPDGAPHALTIDDLPEQVARPFTERDGTRGCIVYIVPTSGFSVWDAHYLMRWADSFRSTTLPTGEVIHGSGSAVIYADMIKTIGEDAPKAIAFSALGSILVILAAFRGNRRAWGVFLPWLLGIGGLFSYLYFSATKLNFLSFVAIPITIGIGAEYAHNMMQRYRVEGPERVYHVTVETGGAVILCSLTTTIGYLALTLSINRGIRSFGMAAAIGEIACVVAAVLVLPAALFWLSRRRATTSSGPNGAPRREPSGVHEARRVARRKLLGPEVEARGIEPEWNPKNSTEAR